MIEKVLIMKVQPLLVHKKGDKMILQDSIEMRTTPEEIFEWITHFEENYRAWHPDHVTCRWIKGGPAQEGSVLYIEEYVHGELHKMTFRMTKIEPTRIEYDVSFPLSVVCPRGSFHIHPKGKSCVFTATLTFRFGALLRILFEKRVDALRMHMKEEGENLKQLLEKDIKGS